MSITKAGTTRAEADAATKAAVAHAVSLQRRILRLRATIKMAEEARNVVIRYAAMLGAERKATAEEIGISRASLYLILEDPDAGDREVFQWIEDQQSYAHYLWDLNGRQGSIDDYWPLAD